MKRPDEDPLTLRQMAIGLAVMGCVSLLVGCASATKHKWMSRFFDGVPPLGSKTNVAAVVDGDLSDTNLAHVVLPEPGEPVRVINSVHAPFGNRECNECHESKFSQKMKAPLTTLCFECHDNFLAKPKIKHQPVDLGDCTSCHNPHEAPHKKLLVRLGTALCLECHDDPLEKGKVKHQPVGDNCLDCHSPHASDIKGLLKKPLAATCFECHDDFLQPAKFKHDPAGNGECMSCHAPHQSDFKGLLIKPGRQLCFECHEESDINKVRAHQRFPEKDCSSCHDPHGGSDKLFIKPGVLQMIREARNAAPANL